MKWPFNQSAEVGEAQVVSHNHYDSPNYGEMAMAGLVVVVAVAVLVWFGGLYVLSQMGVKNPSHVLSESLVVGGLLFIIYFVLSRIAEKYVDKLFLHKQKMADREVAIAEYNARMKRSESVDKREVSDNQRRFNRVVEYIIEEAYSKKEYGWNDARIWARRNAKGIVLANEQSPIGEAMATRVRQWLVDNRVIVGKPGKENINYKQYPDIASVTRLLYGVYLNKDE